MPESTDSPSVRTVLDAAVAAVDGSERPGQVAMAEAVEQTWASGRHLLVQAGTGTGKSLGYLVPSLLRGERVVVATATLALQHQLIERDIPALRKAASNAGADVPHCAVVKGRANYACLHRVREGVPDEQGALIEVPEGALGAEVVKLREWAETQAEREQIGDRDSAPSHSERAWRQISVNHRECLGASRCAHAVECFAERAREDAQEADLVVTNHALLAIDAIDGVPMLPEYDAVVVDEAHELAARVTQAATDELDPGAVERASRRAQSHVEDARGSRALDDLTDAADALADVLTSTEQGRIDVPGEALLEALQRVRDAARQVQSSFGKDTPTDAEDAGRQQSKAMLEDVRQVAERMAAGRETEVLWLGESRGGPQLRIAPIDVSAALRDKLFADNTVVLTSATLTLGGGFDPVAASLGLTPGEQETWHGLDVGSPFDYAKQGILYVARHLPPPGRDGLQEAQLDEIAALVRAAGGRTLGLFSSRRAAEAAAEATRERLPELDIWCQGDAQLPELARRFAEEPSTCLFGTLSLWQGMDLPGETCQLVIIDRVPFPRPDDPLMSARQRLVDKRGGNGFMTVAASHAALLLAQGSGRLIRRADDRGVVAVLDPRLVTARYGSFLAASLPPMWRTTDRDAVLGALRRLDERQLAQD
ncbi:ATP-dependent DNA helicase [Aeromicrobium sp. CTD01-1L150]|uniref:ATP-dependent DNA helicase n=1 Tax=Aeromicrobium sp. CTD01-1L150 TaxID=3341830 RepID=UPI0035C03499